MSPSRKKHLYILLLVSNDWILLLKKELFCISLITSIALRVNFTIDILKGGGGERTFSFHTINKKKEYFYYDFNGKIN